MFSTNTQRHIVLRARDTDSDKDLMKYWESEYYKLRRSANEPGSVVQDSDGSELNCYQEQPLHNGSSSHSNDGITVPQNVNLQDPSSLVVTKPLLTHTDTDGRAKMVDVTSKDATRRSACAQAKVMLGQIAFRLVKENKMKKGDVMTVAKIAGIIAAKRTSELIPLCHNLNLTGVDIECTLNEADCSVLIQASVTTVSPTGVEMEALTAATVCALTVYDMCKAVEKNIVITDVRLLLKTGGASGNYVAST